MSGANFLSDSPVIVSIEDVQNVLGEALQLGSRIIEFLPDTPLIGSLPELDSMAIITVITAVEKHFNVVVEDDDDISAAFETVASLASYIESKAQLS